MEGLLWIKQGSRIFSGWKRRLFIVENDTLLYYSKSGLGPTKGIFRLRQLVNLSQNTSVEISLTIDKHTFSLKAATEHECDAWFSLFGSFQHTGDETISIPSFMEQGIHTCLDFLEESGAYSINGIFRISAQSEHVKSLFQRMMRGETNLNSDTDPHIVAGVLKKLLRELPETIFTERLYNSFRDTPKDVEEHSGVFLKTVNSLIDKLPTTNKQILGRLAHMFYEIGVTNVDTTLMTVKNLCICFDQNFLTKRSKNIPLIDSFFPIMNYLTLHQDAIFGSRRHSPSKYSVSRSIETPKFTYDGEFDFEGFQVDDISSDELVQDVTVMRDAQEYKNAQDKMSYDNQADVTDTQEDYADTQEDTEYDTQDNIADDEKASDTEDKEGVSVLLEKENEILRKQIADIQLEYDDFKKRTQEAIEKRRTRYEAKTMALGDRISEADMILKKERNEIDRLQQEIVSLNVQNKRVTDRNGKLVKLVRQLETIIRTTESAAVTHYEALSLSHQNQLEEMRNEKDELVRKISQMSKPSSGRDIEAIFREKIMELELENAQLKDQNEQLMYDSISPEDISQSHNESAMLKQLLVYQQELLEKKKKTSPRKLKSPRKQVLAQSPKKLSSPTTRRSRSELKVDIETPSLKNKGVITRTPSRTRIPMRVKRR